MECLGLAINLVSGNYEFPSLITITDPRFWDEFSGACLPNWEAQDIQLHSTQNPDLLAELVRDPRWTNEGLFALTRGLLRLAKKHPDHVQPPSLEATANE